MMRKRINSFVLKSYSVHNNLTLFPSPKKRDGAFCKSKHYIFHIISKIVSANFMYIKSFSEGSWVCAFASLPFGGRFRGGYYSLPISYSNAQKPHPLSLSKREGRCILQIQTLSLPHHLQKSFQQTCCI